MREYITNPTPSNSPGLTLSSTELLELIAVRESLTAIIDYWLQTLDVLRRNGALHLVTHAADDEVVGLVDALTDRRARLQLRLTTVEQLAAVQ